MFERERERERERKRPYGSEAVLPRTATQYAGTYVRTFAVRRRIVCERCRGNQRARFQCERGLILLATETLATGQ